jgi:uncharacterized protein YegP (UPF0339 family)
MSYSKFEIDRARDGQWYFRLVAPNGEVVLTSETYRSRAGAQNGIAAIQLHAPRAIVVDNTESTGSATDAWAALASARGPGARHLVPGLGGPLGMFGLLPELGRKK